jgi:hypothetical protein
MKTLKPLNMSTKKAREAFKEMINLCYDEDYPELHRELLTLEANTKKQKELNRYAIAMQEVLNIIPLFADDFPLDVLDEIEEVYQNFLEEE